jgi:hypothetical protein
MHSLQEIEHAITELQPQQLAELYAWLDQHRPAHLSHPRSPVFEQGLGLFSSPKDARLLDEVVANNREVIAGVNEAR